MSEEGKTNHGRAADLRNVAKALRGFARRLEDGTLIHARTTLLINRDPLEKLTEPKTEAELAAAREAELVMKDHKELASRVSHLVKDNLYLLTSCANTYGCNSLSQKAIAWLGAAIAHQDTLSLFVHYQDSNIVQDLADARIRIGIPHRRSVLSVLADQIDAWTAELEKAEHVESDAIATTVKQVAKQQDGLDWARGKGKGIYLWWTWGSVYPEEPTADLAERSYFYRVESEDVAARLCRAFGQEHGDDLRFGYTVGEALDIDEAVLANDSIAKYRRREFQGEDKDFFWTARQWERLVRDELGVKSQNQSASTGAGPAHNDIGTKIEDALDGLLAAVEKHRLTFLFFAHAKRKNPSNRDDRWETLCRDDRPEHRIPTDDIDNEGQFLFRHRLALDLFAETAVGRFGLGEGRKPSVLVKDGKWVEVEGGSLPFWELDELACSYLEGSSSAILDACKTVAGKDLSGRLRSLVDRIIAVTHHNDQPKWYSSRGVRWRYLSDLDEVIWAIKKARVVYPDGSGGSEASQEADRILSGPAHPQEIAGRAAKAVLAFEPSEDNKAELDLQTTTDIRTLIMYLRQLGRPEASNIASVYETFVHAARYRVYGETVYDNESDEEHHDRLTRDEPEPDFADMQSILAARLRSLALLALAAPQGQQGELPVGENVARAGQQSTAGRTASAGDGRTKSAKDGSLVPPLAKDLVSKKTRIEFREFLVGWTLREISNEFDAVDIRCDTNFVPDVSGQRRSLVEQYYHTLNFTSPVDIGKLVQAYDNILTSVLNKAAKLETSGYPDPSQAEQLRQVVCALSSWLKKDGFKFENGKITPTTPAAKKISDRPSAQHTISEVTRRNIFDALRLGKFQWAGRLSEPEFLARLYNLDAMPSTDHRFHDAAGDIAQHRIANPDDWPDDWVFTDSRFDLNGGTDGTFLRFLCEIVHPLVQPDEQAVESLVAMFNIHLAVDGWEIVKCQEVSGKPVLGPRRISHKEGLAAGQGRAAPDQNAGGPNVPHYFLSADPGYAFDDCPKIRPGLGGVVYRVADQASASMLIRLYEKQYGRLPFPLVACSACDFNEETYVEITSQLSRLESITYNLGSEYHPVDAAIEAMAVCAKHLSEVEGRITAGRALAATDGRVRPDSAKPAAAAAANGRETELHAMWDRSPFDLPEVEKYKTMTPLNLANIINRWEATFDLLVQALMEVKRDDVDRLMHERSFEKNSNCIRLAMEQRGISSEPFSGLVNQFKAAAMGFTDKVDKVQTSDSLAGLERLKAKLALEIDTSGPPPARERETRQNLNGQAPSAASPERGAMLRERLKAAERLIMSLPHLTPDGATEAELVYAENATIEYLKDRFGEQDDALGNWPGDWYECPEAWELYKQKIIEYRASEAAAHVAAAVESAGADAEHPPAKKDTAAEGDTSSPGDEEATGLGLRDSATSKAGATPLNHSPAETSRADGSQAIIKVDECAKNIASRLELWLSRGSKFNETRTKEGKIWYLNHFHVSMRLADARTLVFALEFEGHGILAKRLEELISSVQTCAHELDRALLQDQVTEDEHWEDVSIADQCLEGAAMELIEWLRTLGSHAGRLAGSVNTAANEPETEAAQEGKQSLPPSKDPREACHPAYVLADTAIVGQEPMSPPSKPADTALSELAATVDTQKASAQKNWSTVSEIEESINKLAPTDVSILLLGESGTGKEFYAEKIRNASARKNKSFVVVNCATLPKERIDAELYGYVKGAFTGAVRDEPGKIRAAEGGTVFLDEIGDLPEDCWGNLLRFLHQKEIHPVGGRNLTVDVRILAATNRRDRIRRDALYRFDHVLCLPPLRARREDIPDLANDFFKAIALRSSLRFSAAERHKLGQTNYHWPGNIRQLQKAVQNAMRLHNSGRNLTCEEVLKAAKSTENPA